MKRIWNRLRGQIDPEVRHLVYGLLTVLLLTLFARASAGASRAQVTVSWPEPRTLTGEVYAAGTLTPLGETRYAVPDGLVITDAVAEVGDTVKEGDPVALVDPDALDELLTRRQAELTQLELRLEALLDNEDPSDAQVKAAKAALSSAKEARNDREAELVEAEEALVLAVEEEKAAAEAAVHEAEARLTAAQAQVTAAKEALEQAENAYADAKTQARRTREANEAEASVLQLDVDKASAELEALEAVRDAGYCVAAPSGGVLAEQPLTEGTLTGGHAVALSNPYGGHLLTFALDREDAALLTAGMKVTISREDLTADLYACTPDPDTKDMEQVTYTAPVLGTQWETGAVGVHAVLWEEDYDACIPVTALRQDGRGYFVYVLARETDLWGVRQTVRRADVQIERLDGIYAAVYGVDAGAQVIVTSSKPLVDGSPVRVTP